MQSLLVKPEAKPIMPLKQLIEFCLEFCQLLSGRVLYPYQKAFARGIIRTILTDSGSTITALFARQSGKSQSCADVMSGLMLLLPVLANMEEFSEDERLQLFKKGFWVGIFAPSKDRALGMFQKIRDNFGSPSAKAVFETSDFAHVSFSTYNSQNVSLSTGSFVRAVSASDNANIEGDSYMYIVIDEAQDVSDYVIRKSIIPMGTAYNASCVLIGTPNNKKCFFLDTLTSNKVSDSLSRTENKRLHYEFNCDEAAKYNKKYAKALENTKMLIGEESDEYLMSYKLVWRLERGMFLDYENYIKHNANPFSHLVSSDLKNAHVAGIDVASISDGLIVTIVEPDWENPAVKVQSVTDTGETVQYDAYDTMVKAWKSVPGGNYENIYAELLAYLSLWNIKKILIDGTRERAFAERLQAQLLSICEVEIFVFTSASKSDLFKCLDTEIKTKRAKFPYSDEVQKTKEFKDFLQQMSDLEKTYNGVNMVVSHPTTRNARDDYPDSYALAIWGTRSPAVAAPQITTKKNEFFRGYNPSFSMFSGSRQINQYTGRKL